VVRSGDLIAALFVGGLLFGAVLVAVGGRTKTQIADRLRAHIPELSEPDAQPQRRHVLHPYFAVADRIVSAIGVRRRLESVLERAGSDLSPAQLSLIMAGSALAPVLLLRLAGLPAALTLLLLPVGGLIPYVVIRQRGVRRQRAFDDQLPDLLLTMAASARVGHTFRQSLQSIVTEGEEPASAEFQRVLVENDLGRPLDRALADMAERLRSRNFSYVVNVVAIQREVGGSLAGLFDMVSETVRNRQQFAKRVRALTATGRISAYVLVAMPFVAAGIMNLLQPGALASFVSSSSGRLLIIVALAGMTVGAIILKKMVSFRLS
jgi:tight adherence protein B